MRVLRPITILKASFTSLPGPEPLWGRRSKPMVSKVGDNAPCAQTFAALGQAAWLCGVAFKRGGKRSK